MTKGACSFARVLFVIEPIKHRACRTDVTKLGTSRDVARQDSDALGGTRWHSVALRGTQWHSLDANPRPGQRPSTPTWPAEKCNVRQKPSMSSDSESILGRCSPSFVRPVRR